MTKTYAGVDLIEINRIRAAIDRWGDKFLQRVYTERELAQYRTRTESLAARFAAKEAAIKALSLPDGGYISWKNIEILSDVNGKPILNLSGKALQRAQESGVKTLEVSLSHTRENAIAIVIGVSSDERPA